MSTHSSQLLCRPTVSTAVVPTQCRQHLCRHAVATASVSPHSVDSCCANTVSTASVSPRCCHSFCVATLCCQYQTNALCQTVADQTQFTTVLTDGWPLFQASNISRQLLQFPSSTSLQSMEQRKVTLAPGRSKVPSFCLYSTNQHCFHWTPQSAMTVSAHLKE